MITDRDHMFIFKFGPDENPSLSTLHGRWLFFIKVFASSFAPALPGVNTNKAINDK